MRNATPKEIESISKYINSIGKLTNVNFENLLQELHNDDDYEKDLNDLKEEILKEGNTLVTKQDLLERFVRIDEYRPWNLLQILTNICVLNGEKPKTGHWIRMSDLSEEEDDRYQCSRCRNVVHYKNKMDLYTFNSWCGRCGSNNRESEDKYGNN